MLPLPTRRWNSHQDKSRTHNTWLHSQNGAWRFTKHFLRDDVCEVLSSVECEKGSQWITFRSRGIFLTMVRSYKCGNWGLVKGLSQCHVASCNSFWNKVGVGLMEGGKVWCSCPLRCMAQGGMKLPIETLSLNNKLWVIFPFLYFSTFPRFSLVCRIKLLV